MVNLYGTPHPNQVTVSSEAEKSREENEELSMGWCKRDRLGRKIG
jgi:hypothetical protein